jgi:hypothetical protein
MARKKSKRARGKLTGYLTQRYLYYDLNHTGTDEDFHYIDLARDLSAVNMRLYRQGMVYGVQSFSIHDSQENTEVRIGTIPTVWPVLSAYRLARRQWNRQIKSVDTGGIRGAWDDFRIFMNTDHVTDTDQPVVVNIESHSAGTKNESILYGEYNASMLSATTHGSDCCLAMLGAGNSGFNGNVPAGYGGAACDGIIGMVAEWSRLKADVPETPESGTDDAASSAFGDGVLGLRDTTYDNDMLDRIEEFNDNPPYGTNIGAYLAESAIDSWTVREAHMATGQKSVMLPGCEVFCGLMQVETKSATDGNTIGLLVELAPGAYKGVHALEI